MKRKIITGALVGCLAVSGLLGLSGCSTPDPYASYTKATTESLSTQVNNILRSNYHLKLDEGNYDELVLQAHSEISGEGTLESPYIYQKEVKDFVLVGEGDKTVVDGFAFDQGLFVNYKPEGGVDYYHYDTFKIENLIIKNMTFSNHFVIGSTLTDVIEDQTIQIENVVFENVTFDFDGVEAQNNAAFYLSNPNGGVDNVTFNKCSFQNCVSTNVMNAILVVSENTADDINLTVQNCNFESINYNAIQMSGVNSSFGGEIRILNNNINNTGDRAISISTLGSTANFKMKDNIMTNASDADGELCKATIQSGARFVIKNNYWGAQIGLAPICGLVDGSAGGSMIADMEPRTSAN